MTWKRADEAPSDVKEMMATILPSRLGQSRLGHTVFGHQFLLVLFNDRKEPACWHLIDIPDWW